MKSKHRKRDILPKTKEVTIGVPTSVCKELYLAGYKHGLVSNTLTIFKQSYMLGFRQAKLEKREKQKVRSLPQKVKFKT